MSDFPPAPGGLALYKIRPALITAVTDKIDIQLEGGKSKRVRPKDIAVLHPGPLSSLSDLGPQDGNLDEAWELLSGSETNLRELAELMFNDFSPATAWATWEIVADGLYFEGTPTQITARTEEQVSADRDARAAKAKAEQEWADFLARLAAKTLIDDDRKKLGEVEQVALGRAEKSRILQALGHQESPQNAHRMLVSVGYWTENHNPYPERHGLALDNPRIEVPRLPSEERRDLTHLAAFAIDDEGSEDPDDAISLDGDTLWVHVADVAALIEPDSELDLDARQRAANLYVPERIVHMLPPEITSQLGLGLQDISPALSFGMTLDNQGAITHLEIAPSLIRASRHTYAEINERLDEAPFRDIVALTNCFLQRRKAAGSASIDLPEVSVRVVEGDIRIRPLERLGSRQMVTEAMLMVGEAVAQYGVEHEIPLPFASQNPPDSPQAPVDLAGMYAYRRQMKPSRSQSQPEPHAGLGLAAYTRATSPLRRYLDLVAHQQLRAHLRGDELMAIGQITERVAAVDGTTGAIRKAERFSNTHWKMLLLKKNSQWRGQGVVVEQDEQRATILIPALALETKIRTKKPLELNSEVNLAVREVDVTDLTAWFRIV
ncbi:MAG: RNB domain-containing ribonuclease [Chromatiales bacterium]|nr:RNB domain-containing ribonuclease [Chromatiales bacterium]